MRECCMQFSALNSRIALLFSVFLSLSPGKRGQPWLGGTFCQLPPVPRCDTRPDHWEMKVGQTSLWETHSFGQHRKSRRTGLCACFPLPGPKDNGFTSLTSSAVLSPLLHTISLILVFIDGCANTDILWFLNCADGRMALKSIPCGSFIFPALDTICPLC